MKKNILKMLALFLLLPVLTFVGCKKSKTLPAISVSKYFQQEISIKRNSLSDKGTLIPLISSGELSTLTKNKPDLNLLSQYLKFEINADPVWIYKMYIQKISFYVYCNESSESLMTINLTISDVATEEAIWAATQETVESETFDSQCSFTPKANSSIKCNFEINRTVIVATGSKLTIDIEESKELFSTTTEYQSTFMWMIYGLEIHGESRAYTR